MRVLESRTERAGPNRWRVITTIEVEEPPMGGETPMGEGPTGNAIPDRIVQALVENGSRSMTLAEIQRAVGGNPSTVNRQAWTLANNAPDLQRRLRGWVVSVDRGRYALSPAATERLGLAGA